MVRNILHNNYHINKINSKSGNNISSIKKQKIKILFFSYFQYLFSKKKSIILVFNISQIFFQYLVKPLLNIFLKFQQFIQIIIIQFIQKNIYQLQKVQKQILQNLAKMLKPSQPISSPTHITQRQHFNYLRNNSCHIWNTFNWGTNTQSIQNSKINIRNQYQLPHHTNLYTIQDQGVLDKSKKKNLQVSFDQRKNQQQPQIITQPYTNINQPKIQEKKRPSSAFQKRSKLQKNLQLEEQKGQQNRQKVINYIQQIRPYTRALSNTKFQDYFGKAAPECYGRANTNQPIGGIIYGNHLKSFNINPHVYTNKPQYYQTHNTAINYGKRAKVCQDKRWKRLQKQLTKKLGLKQAHQSIKQGKQIVYVDVDDKTKNQILKSNHQFQKANKQQIHHRQLQYKKQQHLSYIDNINQYYANKKQKIAQNLSTRHSIDYTGSTLSPDQLDAKLNQQVVYKYHDKQGNTRLAVDRHGMTCYVDMKFPQNQPAYIQQLKNRLPIFPIKVQGQNKYIDTIRKQNCQKGKQEVYPSHYLLRNCQQPEVLKMLSNKAGVAISQKQKNQRRLSQQQRKIINNNKNKPLSPPINNASKSFASTANTKSQYPQYQQPQQTHEQTYSKPLQNTLQNTTYPNPPSTNFSLTSPNKFQQNKQQILDTTWKNPQVVNQVLTYINKPNQQHIYLPHNQMNPQSYKYASQNIRKIPYAK